MKLLKVGVVPIVNYLEVNTFALVRNNEIWINGTLETSGLFANEVGGGRGCG